MVAQTNMQQAQSLLNATRQRILEDAELAMPADKYPLFRKRVLDIFGDKGLERKLMALLSGGRTGDGRE